MTKRGLRWTLLLWFGVITLVSLSACTGLAGDTEIVATVPLGNTGQNVSNSVGNGTDNPADVQAAQEGTAAVTESAPVTDVTPTSLASFGLSVFDQTQEAPGDLGYPSASPNLTNGAAIFAQHCTACHGGLGAGDGRLVLNGEVPAPHSFRDAEYVRQITPKEWFRTITNGRLENLMPPWKDALTEQQRWDVTMYTYTLHYTPDQLEMGRVLFSDCAECHGDTGNGDGPDANKHPESPAAVLTSLRSLNDLSDANIYTMVHDGQPDLMPAYGDEFTDEEIRAVVAYARTLGLTNIEPITVDDGPLVPPPTGESRISELATAAVTDTGTTGGIVPPQVQTRVAAQEATPDAAPDAAAPDLTISGTVTNATAGGTVPAGMTVTLHVYSAEALTEVKELLQITTLDAAGRYQFTGVSYRPELVYLTTVNYQNRDFASGIYQADESNPLLDMPIVLYELTDDPAVVTVNASITQIQVGGDTLEATYSVRFVNTSDRLFTSLEAEADGRRYRSVHVTLPPGALVVGIVDQPRYIHDEAANAVYDTSPLQPGEERFIQVTYLLDYSSGAVIEYTTPYKLDGQLRVLIETPTITLEGDLFPPQGEEQLGGVTFQGYGDPATLDAGATIRYTLHGEGGETAIVPGSSAASALGIDTSGVVTSDALLPMLIVIALGMVIVGGVYMLVRRSPNMASPVSQQHLIDGLVRQIAELDAQHDAGQINHDVYRQRREQLKARLAELMDERTTAS